MRASSLILAIFLFSCGVEDAGGICPIQQSEQTGTYLLKFKQIIGDCSVLDNAEVRIKNGIVYPAEAENCFLDSSKWLEHPDICSTKSVFVCDDGEWQMSLEWIVSTWTSSGGINGFLKTRMHRWDDSYSCASEYTFEADPVPVAR